METDSVDDGMTLCQCRVAFAGTGVGDDVDEAIQGAYLRADIEYVLRL